ncbi:MAG: type IV pilus assembly protein PilM [Candidatus Saccharimonadales bacterium]
MNLLSGGDGNFFGLDIGSSAIRVVQLKGTQNPKELDKYGQLAATGNMTLSDSKEDQARVTQTVREVVKKSGIASKNVVANLPSNRVFTTVIDMDRMAPEQLAQTINYQADSIIPTPLEQSKIDWAIIGNSPKDPKKVEVLLSSVANSFIEARLDMLEAAGLNVIAFEPDSLALMRAVIPPDTHTPQLILDVGSVATDLVVAMGGAPRLTRAIPIGASTLIRAASQNLNIEPAQAQQFVAKFGVSRDKLEGKIYNAIIATVDNLMAEIEKSIKFFQSRYPNTKLERIIVTGGASSLPEFPLYIANRFGINVEIGNAWRNVSFSGSRQNELLSVSNHFAVAAGLAERTT